METSILLSSILSLGILGLILGIALGLSSRFFKVETNPLVDEITEMMPGSNCGQCGFPGCAPAAEAIVNKTAPVTCCPPGGRSLAEEMAAKLGITVDLSALGDKPPQYAQVDENLCIGCARCMKKCPTDAIVGATNQIHAVIVDACTGCEACIDICPTECLQMHDFEETLKTWRWDKPIAA